MNHKNHGNNQPARPSFSGGKTEDFRTQWGVTEDNRIIAIFPRAIPNWVFTSEEADAVIEAIRAGQAEVKRRLEAAANTASAAIDKAAKQ